MTRSSSKSLPPLPVVATHAAVSSDALQGPMNGGDSSGRRRSWVTNNCIRTTITLVVFAAYIAWTWPWHLKHGFDDIEIPVSDGGAVGVADVEVDGIVRAPPLGIPKSLQRKWAQYSPWHPLTDYSPPPEGCEIDQVHILQRHGARYPNEDDGEQYSDAVDHILSADKFSDKRMKFLKKYEYDLGAEDLVPFGAAQSFESGGVAFKRYAKLVDRDNIPFVRAAGAPRVISTATNWTVGFAAASGQRIQPYLNVIISEEYNNTLNQDCPNAPDGTREMGIWESVAGPAIAARLNMAAPGATLNTTHVFNLLAMCPFESVAKEVLSPFCEMFAEDDFRAFEYRGDLEKYYRTGYGEPLGPVQGVGYVNELLARLTNQPVDDHTTHNSSLEFPLGRKLYADFTHENLMIAVYAAMGLFNDSEPLDPRAMPKDYLPSSSSWSSTPLQPSLEYVHPVAHLNARQQHMADLLRETYQDAENDQEQSEAKTTRTWIASRMVPFSSRMVTERLTCTRPNVSSDEKPSTYVRVLVNDEVQPLEFCGGGEDRMCALEDFVASQGYARRSGDGDFDKCYG